MMLQRVKQWWLLPAPCRADHSDYLLVGIEPDTENTPDICFTEDNVRSDLFRVYPNPASDKLYVDLSLSLQGYRYFDILNSAGMKILSGVWSGRQIPVKLDNMTNGIYFIRFSNREKVITGKFLVKK